VTKESMERNAEEKTKTKEEVATEKGEEEEEDNK
jgi:hypothetical protein